MRNVKKPKAYGDRAGPITRLSHLSRSSSSTGRDQMPVQGRKQSRRKVMPAARHRIQASRAHRLRRDAPNSLRSQLMRETCRAACGAGRRRAHRRLASSCCRSSLQQAARWPRHRTPASWTIPPRHCPRTWPRDSLWQEDLPRPKGAVKTRWCPALELGQTVAARAFQERKVEFWSSEGGGGNKRGREDYSGSS